MPPIPDIAEKLSNVQALLRQARHDEAIALGEDIVAEAPLDPRPRMLKATALAELRRFPEALAEVDAALVLAGEAPWSWYVLKVNLLRDSGHVDAALAAARALQAAHPQRAVVHNTAGLLHGDRDEHAAALAAFRQARTVDPHYVPAYLNAARALHAQGARDAAMEEVRLGLAAAPDDPQLALFLASLCEAAGNVGQAQAHYARAASGSRPESAAWKGLARTLYAQADLFGAIDAYRRASELDDRDWTIWNALGNCHLDLGLLQDATRAYRRAMELRPDIAGLHDNLLLSHLYDPAVTAEQVFEAHRAWEARFAAQPLPPRSTDPTHEHRRVRVGFISHAFGRGPTGYFLRPLLRHLDRTRFALHAYSVGPLDDDITVEIRAAVDAWEDVGHMTDESIARKIRNDGIDVLIDLSGHATGNRLRVMTYRPAPRSATWLDYVDTTGLSTVDVFVGDDVSVPEDTPQRFSERVVRVGPARLCYAPPSDLPPVAASPLHRTGEPTFGSFNRVSKMTEPTLDLWCALLRDVPRSRLILKSGVFANARTRAHFLARFERRGVASGRITLRDASPHRAMLEEYGDIDIALDTFPYNGGLTTCESLVMGVPVVAMLGDVLVSRQSAALLTAAGFDDLVVTSHPQWLARHRALLDHPHALARRRETMRAAMLGSALCDGHGFARRFEAAVLDALVRGSPPSSPLRPANA